MALSCSPCQGDGFGPLSALALVCRHPHLLTLSALRHPVKLCDLMVRSKASAVRQLCDALPPDVLSRVLDRLLEDVRRSRLVNVLVPVINGGSRESAALRAVARDMDPQCMGEIVDRVPAKNILVFLRAPAEKLVGLLRAVESDNHRFLISVMLLPPELLEETVVPFLEHLSSPDKLGSLINGLDEPDVLLLLLRGGVAPGQLAGLIDAFGHADLAPGGRGVLLMRELAEHRGLVRDRVLPLLRGGNVEQLARLVQGMPCGPLLEILRRVETENLVALMANTNTDVVVRMAGELNLFSNHMAHVADGLGRVMLEPAVAKTISQTTDYMWTHISRYDKCCLKGMRMRVRGDGAGEAEDTKLADFAHYLAYKAQKEFGKTFARSRPSAGMAPARAASMPREHPPSPSGSTTASEAHDSEGDDCENGRASAVSLELASTK
mmetsp:Transcript_82281/g.233304  ORF Transcript_82281/g.233304 Transcript_82281/m.233304 type:complete len:437 (+) Transcript_82281:68-1378(+)